MNYFKLSPSSSAAVCGVFPQVQSMTKHYNYEQKESIDNLCDWIGEGQGKKTIDGFMLHRSAKLTDMVSASMAPFGFLLSSKADEFFRAEALPHYVSVACNLYVNHKIEAYHAGCFNSIPVVDHSDSSFRITKNGAVVESNVRFTSEEGYRQKFSSVMVQTGGLYELIPERLALGNSPRFANVFYLPTVGLFTSDASLNKLKSLGITGWHAATVPFDLIFEQ